MELRGDWRVIVPIRGKLTPHIHPEKFSTRFAALNWLQSEEGLEEVYCRQNRKSAALDTVVS